MEFSRRRFFGLLAGAAAAAGASILARGAGEQLTVAPAISPESYTPAPLPDPLDARNWGKAQLAPMDFYVAAAEAQRGLNYIITTEAETRLWGTPFYASRSVPSGCIFSLGTSGIWDVAPDPRYSGVIANIRAPGPYFDDEEEAA